MGGVRNPGSVDSENDRTAIWTGTAEFVGYTGVILEEELEAGAVGLK